MSVRPGAPVRNKITADLETPSRAYHGSLGCFVHRPGEQALYLLSVTHVIGVFGYASKGQIIQASDPRSSTVNWFDFAELVDFTTFGNQNEDHKLDVALARVINPQLVGSAKISGFDVLPRLRDTPLTTREPVRLYGAKSKVVAEAEILRTGASVEIDYLLPGEVSAATYFFSDQILYGRRTVDGTVPVTQAGDSGSLVFDEMGCAVGLHVAVTRPSNIPWASICTPIELILNRFYVQLLTEDIHSSVPSEVTAPPPVAAVSNPPTDSIPVANVPSSVVNVDSMQLLIENSSILFGESVAWMFHNHRFFDGGIFWRMSLNGLVVDGQVPRTIGKPITVDRIWRDFGHLIDKYATQYAVPAELIVATICTESRGNAAAIRHESRGRLSVGLMQTLVGTARDMLGDAIGPDDLRNPDISIQAGAAYINAQRSRTNIDPPLVACAYNAGGLYFNNSVSNRWRLRQYPIGTGKHADRYVEWFNDCFAYFGLLVNNQAPVSADRQPVPKVSFFNATRSHPQT